MRLIVISQEGSVWASDVNVKGKVESLKAQAVQFFYPEKGLTVEQFKVICPGEARSLDDGNEIEKEKLSPNAILMLTMESPSTTPFELSLTEPAAPTKAEIIAATGGIVSTEPEAPQKTDKKEKSSVSAFSTKSNDSNHSGLLIHPSIDFGDEDSETIEMYARVKHRLDEAKGRTRVEGISFRYPPPEEFDGTTAGIIRGITAAKKLEFIPTLDVYTRIKKKNGEWSDKEIVDALRNASNQEEEAIKWLRQDKRVIVDDVMTGLESNDIVNAITQNPSVRIGLTNPHSIIPLFRIVENVATIYYWITDKDFSPFIISVFEALNNEMNIMAR